MKVLAGTVRFILISLLVLAVCSPLYFSILRTAVFNTTPRDDYAPYLLHIIHLGGSQFGSPFGYRFLSVAIAIPLYYIEPLYRFTNAPQMATTYLRATEALSMISFLSVIGGSAIQYLILRRLRVTRELAVCGAFLFFLGCGFIGLTTIDPLALFMISVLFLWIDKPILFSLTVLPMAIVNEKIVVLWFAILWGRYFYAKIRHEDYIQTMQLIAVSASAAIYGTLVALWHLPGDNNQRDILLYPRQAYATLLHCLNSKGLILNVLPVVLLTLAVFYLWRSPKSEYKRIDSLGLVALILAASVGDVTYNVGRISIYFMPIIITPLVIALSTRSERNSNMAGAAPRDVTL